MTAEDLQTMNNLLEKYDMKALTLAFTENGQPMLLPEELNNSVKSVLAIKKEPPADFKDPHFNIQIGEWEERNVSSQAKLINSLQEDVKELQESKTDKSKLDQMSQSITQLTQMFAQSMAMKGATKNE